MSIKLCHFFQKITIFVFLYKISVCMLSSGFPQENPFNAVDIVDKSVYNFIFRTLYPFFMWINCECSARWLIPARGISLFFVHFFLMHEMRSFPFGGRLNKEGKLCSSDVSDTGTNAEFFHEKKVDNFRYPPLKLF